MNQRHKEWQAGGSTAAAPRRLRLRAADECSTCTRAHPHRHAGRGAAPRRGEPAPLTMNARGSEARGRRLHAERGAPGPGRLRRGGRGRQAAQSCAEARSRSALCLGASGLAAGPCAGGGRRGRRDRWVPSPAGREGAASAPGAPGADAGRVGAGAPGPQPAA